MPSTAQRPHKILIVDDDPLSMAILVAATEDLGCPIFKAPDGETAWKTIEEQGIQLVLADWEMPGLNGLELCRKVRSSAMPRYCYFILVTAHGSPENIVKGLSAGADDFIPKPFNPEELGVRVRGGLRILDLEDHLSEQIESLRTAVKFLKDQSSIIESQKNLIDQLTSGTTQVTEVKWGAQGNLLLEDQNKADLEALMRKVEQEPVFLFLRK